MSEPRMVAVFTAEEDLLAATRDARERGYRIEDIYTPYAVLYHFESLSRGEDDTREKRDRSDCNDGAQHAVMASPCRKIP